jgi:hypothetical protein
MGRPVNDSGLDGSARFGPAILRILASTDAGEPFLAGDVIERESELAILHRFPDSIPTGRALCSCRVIPASGRPPCGKRGWQVLGYGATARSRVGPVEGPSR